MRTVQHLAHIGSGGSGRGGLPGHRPSRGICGRASARSAPCAHVTPGFGWRTMSGAPKPAGPFLGAITKRFTRALPCLAVCAAGGARAGPLGGQVFVAGHRALTSNVVPAPGALAPAHSHTGIAGNRSTARRPRRSGSRKQAPWALRRQALGPSEAVWKPTSGCARPGPATVARTSGGC